MTKFITLEGVEGVGKTTSLEFIEAFLRSKGVDFVSTREPGGTPLAEAIRDVVLEPGVEKVHADTELLLMFASRAQHIKEVILPALADGKWVVSSRFTDSTYAYQGGGRGISASRIAVLEQWVQGDFQPDLTLFLDLPVEVGLERAKKRGALDRIEQEKVTFFEKVRTAYLERASLSSRYRIIDASQDIAGVQAQLQETLDEYFTAQT